MQILPEQLDGRDILRKFVGESYPGKVIGVDGDHLIIKYESPELEEQLLTVAEVLVCLVGRAPEPAQHQDAPPTAAEVAAALTLYFNGRRTWLKKHNPEGTEGPALRRQAEAEWPKLSSERQLVFVRRVRAKALAQANGAVAPRVLKRGAPVPRRLWGCHKGAEVLLVERGLPSGLRSGCPSEAAHGGPKPPALARRPEREAWLRHELDYHDGVAVWRPHTATDVPPLPPLCGEGPLARQRRSVSHLEGSCCCKRLLAAQPDFRSECSALERAVVAGGHSCFFLPKCAPSAVPSPRPPSSDPASRTASTARPYAGTTASSTRSSGTGAQARSTRGGTAATPSSGCVSACRSRSARRSPRRRGTKVTYRHGLAQGPAQTDSLGRLGPLGLFCEHSGARGSAHEHLPACLTAVQAAAVGAHLVAVHHRVRQGRERAPGGQERSRAALVATPRHKPVASGGGSHGGGSVRSEVIAQAVAKPLSGPYSRI